MTRACVLVLGPRGEAISGVATHLKLLLESPLACEFALAHFEVGSEGRTSGALGRWLRLAASPFRLAAEILRRDAAIVHLNTSLVARAYWRDLVYLAVAKLCGSRVVYQVHGGALPPDFLRAWLPRAALRATLRWPDVLVVLAQCELRAYQAFLPGQNVVLVPNGIDCAAYLGLQRPGGAQRRPLELVYIGRLVATKGLYEIVEALRLARSRVAARLTIAGSGPEDEGLRRRVRELGLTEQVCFAGAVHGEAKLRLLAGADVMLLPTYHPEGLPYALLESMAAGVVPVLTRVAALPDVAAERVHGLFVPPRDPQALAEAIVALAADRAALARMSAACRSRVAAAYSVERVAEDFAAIYSAPRAARTVKSAL